MRLVFFLFRGLFFARIDNANDNANMNKVNRLFTSLLPMEFVTYHNTTQTTVMLFINRFSNVFLSILTPGPAVTMLDCHGDDNDDDDETDDAHPSTPHVNDD